ncbi:unnamed protein product [Parajaminaea phylloscopi]
MCGRFPQPLQYQQFRRSVTPQLPRRRPPQGAAGADNYRASHNVAPNSNVAVVRAVLPKETELALLEPLEDEEKDEEGDEAADVVPHQGHEGQADPPQLLIQSMRWGLLPHYQKSQPEYKDTLNTINARADVLLGGSPMWGRPFAKGQRCVVFTHGFFEWQKVGGTKLPHFVGMDREGKGRAAKDGTEKMLMPMAGLWEKCHIQGEEAPRFTFTIITTDVCDKLSFLHDRQPLILESPEAIALWLDPSANQDEVRRVIKTFQGPLEVYKVPQEVGKVGNDDAAFVQPVEQRSDGLMAAFRRQGKQSAGDKESAAPPAPQLQQDTNSETHAPPPQPVKEEPQNAQVAQPADTTTTAAADAAAGSSRWSPDPFDPPVSPSRPNGGYSTTEDPFGGLSKYGSVSHDDWKATKRRASPERVKMGEGALEGAFKKQRVKQEVEEASRECGGPYAVQSPERSPATRAGGGGASPSRGSATSPSHKTRGKGGRERAGTGGGGDIRSFFAKQSPR